MRPAALETISARSKATALLDKDSIACWSCAGSRLGGHQRTRYSSPASQGDTRRTGQVARCVRSTGPGPGYQNLNS
eukprot:3160335-Rhodomonas_salina.3